MTTTKPKFDWAEVLRSWWAPRDSHLPAGFAPLVVLALLAFYGLFFIYPIFQCVKGAFMLEDGQFTLAYVLEIFRNQLYLVGLMNSLSIAFWSTLTAFAIAMPLAFIADRCEFPGKKLLSALVLVPMILPPFVGAIGFKAILGQEGALNTFLINIGVMNAATPYDWLGEGRFIGVVLLTALHLYPILYLNISAALANIDPAMEEAATNLGCTGLARFFKITLPLIMPGVFAGGAIVFIWGMTELGVPLMFDYTQVASVQIFTGIKDIGGNPFPYALSVVLLVLTVILYTLSKVVFGRGNYAMMAKATVGRTPTKMGPLGGVLCVLAFALISFLAFIPHLGVVLVSFSEDWYKSILPHSFTLDHYREALGHSLTVPSITNSLKYASIATVVDIFIGVLIAYIVVRTNLPARHLLDSLAMLPLAVPGLILAFGYVAMTQEGQLFEALSPAKDPFLILVIAYSVRRLPYVVRSAAAGLQQSSVALEEASMNLGASYYKTLRKITLPLIAANLIAGGLLAFSFAMLEVSDSLILAQKQQDFPITKAIYELNNVLGTGPLLASALGVWSMVFLGVTILGASLILGKKLGAMFRV
jgi:iron(III) transport system permease protein